MVEPCTNCLYPINRFNPLDYPTEDCDEVARVQRAREIHEGVDPPPGYRTVCKDPAYVAADPTLDNRLSACSIDDKEIVNAIRSIPDGHIEGILNTTDPFTMNLFNSADQQPRIIHSQVDVRLLIDSIGSGMVIKMSFRFTGGFYSLSRT